VTPAGTFGVVVSSTGTVFASVFSGSVIRGDVFTRTFPVSIPVTGSAYEVTLTADERFVLVGHQNSSAGPITIINAATNATVTTVPTPGGVVSSARDQTGLRLFFGLVDTPNLIEVRVQADAGWSSRLIGLDAGVGFLSGAMNGLGYDPLRDTLYVTHTSGRLFTVPSTGGTAFISPAIGTMRGAAFDARRDRFYAVDEMGAGVTRTTPLLAPVNQPPMIPTAWGAALTPDAHELWVTNSNAGTLHIIDLIGTTGTRTVSGLGRPRKIAFEPSGRRAVIANENGEVLFFQ
jgi:DNA-binding beta-propeller fold protein YncE